MSNSYMEPEVRGILTTYFGIMAGAIGGAVFTMHQPCMQEGLVIEQIMQLPAHLKMFASLPWQPGYGLECRDADIAQAAINMGASTTVGGLLGYGAHKVRSLFDGNNAPAARP